MFVQIIFKLLYEPNNENYEKFNTIGNPVYGGCNLCPG